MQMCITYLPDHQGVAAVRSASSRRRCTDRGADVRGRDRRKHEALAVVLDGRRRSVAEGRLRTHAAALRRTSQSHGGDRVPAGPRRGSALRRHVGTNRGGARENCATRGSDASVDVLRTEQGGRC